MAKNVEIWHAHIPTLTNDAQQNSLGSLKARISF